MGTCCCSTKTTNATQLLPTPQMRAVPAPGRADEYTIIGMTCGHCVSSVTKHLNAIAGVRDAVVDLGSGKAVLTSETPVPREVVAAAVAEAGYQLA